MKFTVTDFLEETAEKFPDKIAFSDLNESVTWKEFVAKSKELSVFVAENFRPREAVPVMIEKSVKTLEWFFAAIYAGCFYSYFDSAFPAARINSMIQTLGVKKIVTERKNQKKFSELNAEPVFDDEVKIPQQKEFRRISSIDTDPVYANFTSGTTGTPKAVVVCHKNIVDFISCFTEIFKISSDDRIANQAPFDFDVSVKDIFSAVFTGAQVHLVPKSYFSFPAKLLDFLEEREITTLIWAVSALCIISTLNGFSYRIPSHLKKIMFSGEVMPVKQLKIWKKFVPDAQYVNLYGPTEITCNCTYFILPREIPDDFVLPIGEAFPNERILLLDDDGKEITDDEKTGELCVAGTCVALGYFDNERTEKVFIQNPAQKKYFDRIYRTGDLAKKSGGIYFYLGRKDNQIKHMGHRIELGEIEGALEKNPQISRALCIFKNNRISAFYTGNSLEKKEIVSFLKPVLPPYMIPADFIFTAEFPLTKNGKIDRRALEEKFFPTEENQDD